MANTLYGVHTYRYADGKTRALIGVLLTPCYPCEWYGGFLQVHNGEWSPLNNDRGFFRTKAEAMEAAEICRNSMTKEPA